MPKSNSLYSFTLDFEIEITLREQRKLNRLSKEKESTTMVNVEDNLQRRTTRDYMSPPMGVVVLA